MLLSVWVSSTINKMKYSSNWTVNCAFKGQLEFWSVVLHPNYSGIDVLEITGKFVTKYGFSTPWNMGWQVVTGFLMLHALTNNIASIWWWWGLIVMDQESASLMPSQVSSVICLTKEIPIYICHRLKFVIQLYMAILGLISDIMGMSFMILAPMYSSSSCSNSSVYLSPWIGIWGSLKDTSIVVYHRCSSFGEIRDLG